jgi:hypothetical protein
MNSLPYLGLTLNRYLHHLSASLYRLGFGCLLMLLCGSSTQAQWVTETLNLKSGWNAIYLHVDCTHADISDLLDIAGPIQEIWLWQPSLSSIQFVQSVQQPSGSGSQWFSWKRGDVTHQLNRLIGNAAYLVNVSADFQWQIKGKPVPPRYQWSTTGLNFLGFPTVPVNPPNFDRLFEQDPDIHGALQVFYYNGGASVTNTTEIFGPSLATESVSRGEAYWMRSGDLYNKNYGPFEITIQGGLDFGDSLGQRSFRLRNLNPATNTVTLRLIASEQPPQGQPAIVGVPPVLVRGNLSMTDLTYAYSILPENGTVSWMLSPKGQPGSEVEVVLGINRYAMNNNPGDLLGGILRLSDSFGYSQIHVPLSVEMSSTAGLWVGNATVANVDSYLKSYEKDGNGVPVMNTNGTYVISSVNTNSGPVVRPFSLRLLLHSDGTNAVLLQRVFYGLDTATNLIVTLRQGALDPNQLTAARRISAPHLPWTISNTSWPFTGLFRQGSTLASSIAVNYSDHASNPFLHSYHPDHDNLDATFQSQQPQGYESYSIARNIYLGIMPPADDFSSLTASGKSLGGVYVDQITLSGRGAESRTFTSSGAFSLNRISTIETLTP